MTYKMQALNDLPRFLLMLDETSGTSATDSSGNGYSGTYNGSPVVSQPIVSGAAASKIYGATGNYVSMSNFPQNMWTAGSEEKSFTIEAWAFPRGITTEATIAGRSQNSGLKIGPNYVSFKVNTSGGVIEARYQMPRFNGSAHIVGVYTGDTIGLYVNDSLVATADFSGTFVETDSNFYVGGGSWVSGSDGIQIQSVALYPGVSTRTEIHNRYSSGRLTADYYNTLLASGAVTYKFIDDNASIAFEQLFYLEDDYKAGQTYTNLVYDSTTNRLSMFDTTVAGTWTTQIDIGSAGTVGGSRIDWYSTSTSIVVQTSFDGISWNTETNHSTISIIPRGTDVTEKILYIKIQFNTPPVGQDAPFLDGLHVVIYNTKNIQCERPDITAAVVGADYLTLGEYEEEPIAHDPYSVGTFKNPGYMVIPAPDSTENVSYYGVSFWVRVDSLIASTTNYMFDARMDNTSQAYIGFDSTGAIITAYDIVYINGVKKTPVAADFPTGKWVHVTVHFNTALAGRISVNSSYQANGQSNASYRQFSVLTSDFGDADATRLYLAGISRPSFRYTDTYTIKATENQYTAYKYVWAAN